GLDPFGHARSLKELLYLGYPFLHDVFVHHRFHWVTWVAGGGVGLSAAMLKCFYCALQDVFSALTRVQARFVPARPLTPQPMQARAQHRARRVRQLGTPTTPSHAPLPTRCSTSVHSICSTVSVHSSRRLIAWLRLRLGAL